MSSKACALECGRASKAASPTRGVIETKSHGTSTISPSVPLGGMTCHLCAITSCRKARLATTAYWCRTLPESGRSRADPVLWRRHHEGSRMRGSAQYL